MTDYITQVAMVVAVLASAGSVLCAVGSVRAARRAEAAVRRNSWPTPIASQVSIKREDIDEWRPSVLDEVHHRMTKPRPHSVEWPD